MQLDKFLEWLRITGMILRVTDNPGSIYTIPWKKEFDKRFKEVESIMGEEFITLAPEVLQLEFSQLVLRASEFTLGPKSEKAFFDLKAWCDEQQIPLK